MKVWLVQRAESTPHDDGGKRRLMRMGILAELLSAQGHDVVWWTSCFDHFKHLERFKHSQKLDVKENYSIHYLRSLGYKSNKSIRRFFDNKYVTKQFVKEAYKTHYRPDVILVSMPSIELAKETVAFANKHDIPVIIDIRDLWPDVFVEVFPRVFRPFINVLMVFMRASLRSACEGATAICGITEEFVDWGVRHTQRARRDEDICFPMAYVRPESTGLGENDLPEPDYLSSLGLSGPQKGITLLFLGSFTATSDFETIFAAAENLISTSAPVKFVFCGAGIKQDRIKNRCLELDNCIYAGWVNTPQIKVLLSVSDIGLIPYIDTPNYVQNIPNKPPEYMSEGLALANSLSRGKLNVMIEEEGCGFSYNGSSDLLAKELRRLVDHPDILSDMKASSRAVFDSHLDGTVVYAKMVKYLEDMSGNREG